MYHPIPFFLFFSQCLCFCFHYCHAMCTFGAEVIQGWDGDFHIVFCATQPWRWCTWHHVPSFLLFFHLPSFSTLWIFCLRPTSWHPQCIPFPCTILSHASHIYFCPCDFHLILPWCQIHWHYSVSGIDVYFHVVLNFFVNCFGSHAMLTCYLHLSLRLRPKPMNIK